ncbi:MAG: heterodisulfide reductase-related iron-sulfur binding cluster [Eggerthellaceae bacterium]
MSGGFSLDRLEKAHYPFKRYPKTQCETILFPGCAFPSQFPQAMDRLADICSQNGIGIAYDCCGISLQSHKSGTDARRVLDSVAKRLARCGCKRVACMCPNCFYYLREHLDVEVISTYQLLEELGVSKDAVLGSGVLFVPCPDRKERLIERQMRSAFDLRGLDTLAKGCCGLRPDIFSKGPKLAAKCGRGVAASAGDAPLFVYCASCAGQFKRLGFDGVRHVLPALLGIDEGPDAAHAILNRAKRRFDKRSDPEKPKG